MEKDIGKTADCHQMMLHPRCDSSNDMTLHVYADFLHRIRLDRKLEKEHRNSFMKGGSKYLSSI